MASLESFFTKPKELGEMLKKGMQQGKEEGDVTDQELTQLMEELEVKPGVKADNPKRSDLKLRGEGGSGELRIPALTTDESSGEKDTPTTPKPSQQQRGREEKQKEEEKVVELEEEEEDHWEETQNPGVGVDVEEGDVAKRSIGTSSYGTASHSDPIADLREYCEAQFRSWAQIMTPLLARVEALERGSSSRVPFVPLSASPPRGGGRSDMGSHIRKRSNGVGPLRAGASLEIDKEEIAKFIQKNPTFPSLGRVRESKLRLLQATMGLPPQTLEIKTSDWSKEGIYSLLVTAFSRE